MKAMWTKKIYTQILKTNKQKTISSQRRTQANNKAKKIKTNKSSSSSLSGGIHWDTQAEPWTLSSLTLYIDVWQEGEPAHGKTCQTPHLFLFT
jgi:hypothetical protein